MVQRRLETGPQLRLQVQHYRAGPPKFAPLPQVLLQFWSCQPNCCLSLWSAALMLDRANCCTELSMSCSHVCIIVLRILCTPVHAQGLTGMHDHTCIPLVGSWRRLHTSYSHRQYLQLHLVSSLYDTQVGRKLSLLLLSAKILSPVQQSVMQMDRSRLYKCLLRRPCVASFRQDIVCIHTSAQLMQPILVQMHASPFPPTFSTCLHIDTLHPQPGCTLL